MGGKSYFCDYCRCYMKNDKNVRKTHNDGLAHNIIKASIMKKYEDPRKIYEEEMNKEPCTRYMKGFCKYDLYCQFSHFNETQLKELKELVENLNTKSNLRQTTTKPKLPVKSKVLFKLPWQNKISKRSMKLLPAKLPPSLRPLSFKKLSNLDVSNNKWG
ncbi:uncharacterized protein LOC135951692 [Calliphora vicina]|uniref:uncharacterized protein LOC135951692 n=1 Tax=Calliphora vicina TaxID=7373 RepID=UPI00325B54B3